MELYYSKHTAQEIDSALSAILRDNFGAEEKDVKFYDYDGTLLYSYTLEEAQALTELPPGPTWHDELVFQGWNWSLEEVQALEYPMNIAALYDTIDGALHLHIVVDQELRNTVRIRLSSRSGGAGFIDWGDGSDVQSVAISGGALFTHVYPIGEYVIRIWSDTNGLYAGSGTISVMDASNDNTCDFFLRKVFMGSSIPHSTYSFFASYYLEHISFLPGFSVKPYMCNDCKRLEFAVVKGSATAVYRRCYSLRNVSLAPDVTHIESSQFDRCDTLRVVRTRPNVTIATSAFSEARSLEFGWGKTTGGGSAFYDAANLKTFIFSEGSTEIGASLFQFCRSLVQMDIPATVTTIGANAFMNCTHMAKMVFRSATPPTVTNSNAFAGIPTDCIVEVPVASLATYQAATNYASIAAQMVGV